jgi:hypothetical protein
MSRDGKGKFNYVSIFSLGHTVLLQCVGTSYLMCYLRKLSFDRFKFGSSIRS